MACPLCRGTGWRPALDGVVRCACRSRAEPAPPCLPGIFDQGPAAQTPAGGSSYRAGVASSEGDALVDRLARLFKARPDQWIDGLELGQTAGSYAWRSRVSDLRKEPFNMVIENRVRRVMTATGRTVTVSEYRSVSRS